MTTLTLFVIALFCLTLWQLSNSIKLSRINPDNEDIDNWAEEKVKIIITKTQE